MCCLTFADFILERSKTIANKEYGVFWIIVEESFAIWMNTLATFVFYIWLKWNINQSTFYSLSFIVKMKNSLSKHTI